MTLLPIRTDRRRVVHLVLTLALCGAGHVGAAEPLHQRIDRLIDASLLFPPAPAASDAEFLRRISLDLCNCMASVDEARAFLQNPSANKRTELIERLLASPQHARRMANFLDVTLMERRRDKYVGHPDWDNWLYQACLENRPWDKLVREILTADGADPAKRAPAKFALEREADPHLLTRDVGRVLFGRDVQCAQCHDHPNVKDYEQREYYGLLSFFQRTSLLKEPNGTYVLSEKAEGDPMYQSVFKAGSKFAATPAIPGGAAIAEPTVKPGEEYIARPMDKGGPMPKVSRRELLAQCATAGANRAFNRNIVNRLWAMMMGRGLVHPVDFDHADNPPSHPELLDVLTDEFVTMKGDMRAFVRDLALTQAYQRSFDPPADLANTAAKAIARLPEFEAGVVAAKDATEKASAELQPVRREALAVRALVDQARVDQRNAEAALAAVRKALTPVAAALAEAQRQTQIKTEANASLVKAIEPAKQALAKLPTDADIKQSVDKLQAKSTQLAAELQALAKTVQTQTDAVKQANEKIQTAEKTATDLTTKVQQADHRAQPTLTQYADARAKLRRAKAEMAVSERRLQTAKCLADFRTKSESLSAVEKQTASIIGEVDAAGRASRAAAEQNRDQQRQLTAAEKNCDALRQQIATLKQTLEQRQPAAQSLAAATEQIEKAAAILKDEELTRVVGTVRQRQTALAASLTGQSKQLADREAEYPVAQAKCETLRKDRAGLEQAVAAAVSKVTQIEKQHEKPLGEFKTARDNLDSARKELVQILAEQYAVAPLKHLTAEQMHWSVLQATGILNSYEAVATAELNKKEPLTEPQKKDVAVLAKRSIAIERDVYTKLAGNLGPFVHLYAGGPGQPQFEFFATADQALFMENGDTIRAWTAPGVTLIQRLTKHAQPAAFADELYLSVLNRAPTPVETEEVARWLTRRNGANPAAASELAWAVLASAEFRFNH